jgi:hypothetical protein
MIGPFVELDAAQELDGHDFGSGQGLALGQGVGQNGQVSTSRFR